MPSKYYYVFSRLQVVKERGALLEAPKLVNSSDAAFRAIQECTHISEEAQEVFGMMTLDTRLKITAVMEVTRGTLDQSLIDVREVYKRALLHNAASIIVFHNHPGGSKMPSNADMQLTKKLVEAGKILGIPVQDHFIIWDDTGYTSFREKDLL